MKSRRLVLAALLALAAPAARAQTSPAPSPTPAPGGMGGMGGMGTMDCSQRPDPAACEARMKAMHACMNLAGPERMQCMMAAHQATGAAGTAPPAGATPTPPAAQTPSASSTAKPAAGPCATAAEPERCMALEKAFDACSAHQGKPLEMRACVREQLHGAAPTAP